jgi:hypothetical protein
VLPAARYTLFANTMFAFGSHCMLVWAQLYSPGSLVDSQFGTVMLYVACCTAVMYGVSSLYAGMRPYIASRATTTLIHARPAVFAHMP